MDWGFLSIYSQSVHNSLVLSFFKIGQEPTAESANSMRSVRTVKTTIRE